MERLYERMEANLFAAWARYATGSPDGRPTGFEPVTFVGVSWQVGLPAGRNRAAQNTDVSVEGPIRCAKPPADQSNLRKLRLDRRLCRGTIRGTKHTDLHLAAAGPSGYARQPEC